MRGRLHLRTPAQSRLGATENILKCVKGMFPANATKVTQGQEAGCWAPTTADNDSFQRSMKPALPPPSVIALMQHGPHS